MIIIDNRKTKRKFDEEFKKSIVKLYKSGKSQNALANEYGIALSSVARWVKQYSEVKIDDDTIHTVRHISIDISAFSIIQKKSRFNLTVNTLPAIQIKLVLVLLQLGNVQLGVFIDSILTPIYVVTSGTLVLLFLFNLLFSQYRINK